MTLEQPAPASADRRDAVLDDRYLLERGHLFLSGIQALVRLPIDQARRDRLAGLRTRTFISGYPGSPLGGYDLALHAARPVLEGFGVVHQPGQNEELAATAVTGTQMLDVYPSQRHDGVVGIWYGKGPGMDRSGDAIRHGNAMGTSRHGAVVMLSGEDHEAKSSTLAIQQEWAFVHAGIPVLHPASVEEFLAFGLHAIALSRYSGCWVGMKLVGQLCDGGQTFALDPELPRVTIPELEIGGRPFEKSQYMRFFPVETCENERTVFEERHLAVLAYARANGLDRAPVATSRDRLGILTAGKSWADVRQALQDMGLDDRALEAAGVRLIKMGLLYPADEAFLREATSGLEEVVVVEEKRGFLEERVKVALSGVAAAPRVVGKLDERGGRLFPLHGGMDADVIAERLGPRLRPLLADAGLLDRRLAQIAAVRQRPYEVLPRRTPNYCSGCPHNVSTRLLPGQEAWGAPGCHVFASIIEQPERHIDVITQLGGEGLPWIGLAPFTDKPHIFQNQGDGGLWHSGYQNIRFAVAAGVTMTYKILFNGSVANTGAQDPVGARDVPSLAHMLALEGVRKIAIVASDPRAYRRASLPRAATVHGVAEYDAVVADLERTPGVTVFLYDGECANERRRKEKRGLRPRATRYVLINEDVCENCGHCGSLTNCMSLQKVETEFGPKTQVHQSSCNQDHACLDGDCPSFVTVDVRPGTGHRRPPPPELGPDVAPEPRLPRLDRPYHVSIPGVGGTGVLTVNAILGWAALLDGREAMTYDQTGAAQKWGAVLSSIVLSEPGRQAAANRVGLGRADLYLAFDPMAASDPANLARCDPERTAAVINTSLLPSGELIRDVHREAPVEPMVRAIRACADPERSLEVPAMGLAEALFGDYLAANVLALGYAHQAGLLPLSAAAVERAIELNGVSVRQNLQAFRYGRLARFDPERVAALVERPRPEAPPLDGFADLDPETRRMLAIRAAELREYQDERYAHRYLDFVAGVAAREGQPFAVTREVVRGLHKLMAYKDEYEVARLHLRAGLRARAAETFEAPVRVSYLLHPPLLRAWGLKRKLRLGPWFTPALGALRAMRGLRGTAFDPFGRAEVRRRERALPGWYTDLVTRALARLDDPGASRLVLDVARLPDGIRGYEEIKLRGIERAERQAELLLRQLEGGSRPLPVVPASD
jgi:indolepyruvate ferredoxin oxidoreductase